MIKSISIVARMAMLASLLVLPEQAVIAQATCLISNYRIEQFDWGATLVRGAIGGNERWLYLCTGSGTTTSCDSSGSSKMVSIALTALATGKQLQMYFANIPTCPAVVDNTRPSSVFVSN
jgi:hypothetical protein